MDKGPSPRSTAAMRELRNLYTPRIATRLSRPSPDMALPTVEPARHADPQSSKPVYYLAYGSNLSAETFLGKRGIKPISAINVVVPSLRLTFDLPGIPYREPCFANSGSRPGHDDALPPSLRSHRGWEASEKTPLVPRDERYHKDRWHKGMVGVVYGLTPEDFAHVIATEGAGASYQDITIPCHPLVESDGTVPDEPTTTPIEAHTLFAPPEDSPPGDGGRMHRPDPSYAQPSARYLKLLTDGAAEHKLPAEYREYLAQIRPYTITTTGQRLGSLLFVGFWMPIIMALFALMSGSTDKDGKAPKWAVDLSMGIFTAMWATYDGLARPLFGDGERTLGQGGREPGGEAGSAGYGPATTRSRPTAVQVELGKAATVEKS